MPQFRVMHRSWQVLYNNFHYQTAYNFLMTVERAAVVSPFPGTRLSVCVDSHQTCFVFTRSVFELVAIPQQQVVTVIWWGLRLGHLRNRHGDDASNNIEKPEGGFEPPAYSLRRNRSGQSELLRQASACTGLYPDNRDKASGSPARQANVEDDVDLVRGIGPDLVARLDGNVVLGFGGPSDRLLTRRVRVVLVLDVVEVDHRFVSGE
jgi:hypothetical protein